MDNSSGQIHHLVSNLFKSTGQSLLGEFDLRYDTSSASVPMANTDRCFISVLSASADGIKVLSYIRFSAELGAFLCKGANPSLEDIRDLCGELNNQLVGKVKNQLLAYECRLMLGLPTTLSGKDLAAFSLPKAEVITHVFKCAVGALEIVVHSIIQNQFTMADQPNMSLVGGAEEGTLDFF